MQTHSRHRSYTLKPLLKCATVGQSNSTKRMKSAAAWCSSCSAPPKIVFIGWKTLSGGNVTRRLKQPVVQISSSRTRPRVPAAGYFRGLAASSTTAGVYDRASLQIHNPNGSLGQSTLSEAQTDGKHPRVNSGVTSVEARKPSRSRAQSESAT